MSSDQAAASPASDSSDVAHFGHIDRDRFGRTVIYTTIAIHGDPAKRKYPTYFHQDGDGEVFTLSEIVGQLTVDVVAAIVDDVDRPFTMIRGIWVSISDNPDYESMIVFFKKADSMIETIAWSIAKVLHPGTTTTLIRPLERQIRLLF